MQTYMVAVDIVDLFQKTELRNLFVLVTMDYITKWKH